MDIKVHGCSSKRLKLFIEEGCHTVLQKYVSSRRLDQILIKIKFQSKLLKNEGIIADCDNRDYGELFTPKNFDIRIKTNMRQHEVMLSLFHELMHVKQYILGELKDSTRHDHVHKWAGDWNNFSEHQYYDLPWEVDAHGREKGSYLEWIRTSEILTQKEKNRFMKNKPF